MHAESPDLPSYDKRICSCRECLSWRPSIVPSYKPSPKPNCRYGESVVWRGIYWWSRQDGYYAANKSNGRENLLHREIWRVHKGPLPQGHHIHHIDRDRRNNQLSNLRLLSAIEHAKHHGVADGFFVHKHIEYERCCRHCGKSFTIPKPSRLIFCDDWCRLADRRANRESAARPHPIVNCAVCGISFEAIRRDAKHCSRKCATASQNRSGYMQNYYKQNSERWTDYAEARNAKRRLNRALACERTHL